MTTTDFSTVPQLGLHDLLQRTAQLSEAGQHDVAARTYYAWLASNDSPVAHALQFNLGVELGACGDLAGSELAYLAAVERMPSFAPAWFNLGVLRQHQGRVEQALNTWATMLGAIDRETDKAFYVRALNQLGRQLAALERRPQAWLMFARSLQQDPAQPEIVELEAQLRP